jgi:group I intron endonuclease
MNEHFKRKIKNIPIIGIYQIKNLINGKVYIGQSIDIERRWEQHRYGKTSLVLCKSIKKHGIKNFEFTILETIENNFNKIDIIDTLVNLEQKWMNITQSIVKGIGYNLNKTSKPNLTPNKDINFGKKISKIKIDMNHCGQSITQYTLKGEKIKEWKSSAEVERNIGVLATNISRVCLKKQKSAGGFIWRKSNHDLTKEEINEVNLIKRNRKRVLQLTKDNVPLREFNSIKEATDYINTNRSSSIVAVCKGRHKSYKGYKWCYIE